MSRLASITEEPMQRNAEHYPDPTAGEAIKKIQKSQDDGRKKAIRALVEAVRDMQAKGYQVQGNIKIRDIRRNRTYFVRGWNEQEETT